MIDDNSSVRLSLNRVDLLNYVRNIVPASQTSPSLRSLGVSLMCFLHLLDGVFSSWFLLPAVWTRVFYPLWKHLAAVMGSIFTLPFPLLTQNTDNIVIFPALPQPLPLRNPILNLNNGIIKNQRASPLAILSLPASLRDDDNPQIHQWCHLSYFW